MSTATIEQPKKATAAKAKVVAPAAVDHKAHAATSRKALLNLHQRFDPYAQLLEAEAAINALESIDDAVRGVSRLIEVAKSAVEIAGTDAASLQAVSDRLEEILAVLDAIDAGLDHSLLYGAGTLVALAKVQIDAKLDAQDHPAGDTKDSDFHKGRDLAIEMLKAAEALEGTDCTEPLRWVRDGAAQNRFVLPFLQRLVAEPAQMEGFAAVLSGRLATGDGVRADYFALGSAEYEAGPIGADGTATETDPAPPASPAPATTAKPESVAPALSVEEFDADRASQRLAHARSVSSTLSMIFGNGTGVALSEIRDLTGLMGSVQCLRNILEALHAEVDAVDGEFPKGFRASVFEASSLATLIDEMEWLGQYKFMLGDFTMSEYFGAICALCDQATDAINAPEGVAA